VQGVSVVIPVYNGAQTLRSMVNRVALTLQPLTSFEIILVDDGSTDDTWLVIQDISSHNTLVRGLRLARNFGQHSALVAGIRSARMPVVVTLDDDLQNPPEEIPRLVSALAERDLDVVYGIPQRVEQVLSRRVASRLHRLALKSALGVSAGPHLSPFRAFRTDLRQAFSADVGTNVSLDALLAWGGSRYGEVTVRHDPRGEGASNYTIGKLMHFAIDTATGYSTKPLQAASILGVMTAGFGLFILVFVTARPLVTGQSVPGFPFLASTIAIFAGVQLLMLGVIGEYLARMHFRIMRKPTYVIRSQTDQHQPKDCEL